MERYDGFGMRAISLVVLVTSTCMAEDFLYVFATPPGQRSEIHWVPASKPQTARVLLEDLDQTEVVYRHRGELWWFDRNRLVAADLVGRNENVPSAFDIVDFDRITISDLVRQGDILYWLTGGQVVRSHLLTGELQVLVSGSSRLGGLAVYEDRLYFDHGIAIESIRLDGSDRRQIGTKDARVDSRRAS